VGKKRIDKKHPFLMRIEEGLYRDCEAICLNRQMSMNLLFNEMIIFAESNLKFDNLLDERYPIDDRHGHFVHIRSDWRK
jgi:hypothetical protein